MKPNDNAKAGTLGLKKKESKIRNDEVGRGAKEGVKELFPPCFLHGRPRTMTARKEGRRDVEGERVGAREKGAPRDKKKGRERFPYLHLSADDDRSWPPSGDLIGEGAGGRATSLVFLRHDQFPHHAKSGLAGGVIGQWQPPDALLWRSPLSPDQEWPLIFRTSSL